MSASTALRGAPPAAPAPAPAARGAAARGAAARGAAADQSPERTETECLLQKAWEDVQVDPKFKDFIKSKNITTLKEALENRLLELKIHTKVGTYLDGQHETCPCSKCAGTGKKTPVL